MERMPIPSKPSIEPKYQTYTMSGRQKVLHFCFYQIHVNICIILAIGWAWEIERLRQQIHSLEDWQKIGPLSSKFHWSLTSFSKKKTHKQKNPHTTEKTTPNPSNPTHHHTISKLYLWKGRNKTNKQTKKSQGGNKMFPIGLVTEELNLFVSKELYILKSLLIQFYKDWAVTKPSSQVEEKKIKIRSCFSFLPKLLLHEKLTF